MCKCLKNLEICLHIYVTISFLARLILGALIAAKTGFQNEVLILSIFSLLNSIALLIAWIFFCISYGHGDTYSYQSGGYIYTVTIDTSKEDPEHMRKRHGKADFFFKNGMKIGYISLIFAIGTIEEYFRVDGNYLKERDWEYYVIFIIVTIFELIFVVLLLFAKHYNK